MKQILSFIVCLLLTVSLLSGCDLTPEGPYVPTGDGLTYEDATNPPPEDSDQHLTLIYYPDRSMHPLKSTDMINRTLIPLIYQSLFVVDRHYQVQPMLCKHYRISEDMKTYTIYLEPATFSDGSLLTAQDVVDSLELARQSTYYKGRFTHIQTIEAAEDGAVVIRTDTSMENLPVLLDIPIIRSQDLEAQFPLGTGPYQLDFSGVDVRLRRRGNWWCSAQMLVTAQAITLLEAESVNQIRDSFQFGGLDVVMADPGSDSYADYRCDYELWSVENGIFLYLACSVDSEIFSNDAVRIALTHAIDRDLLVREHYRNFAKAATLPASPDFPYYNQALAAQYGFDQEHFTNVLMNEGFIGSEVTLLVNSDDTLRLRVARKIAAMLEDCGMKVVISAKGGSNYQYAVKTRQYDLYLGQTMLSANMDLSQFFSTYGNLSWGGINDVAAYALCMESLANYGNYYSLHRTVMENGMLCPILFRSYAVYATRGLVTGLDPARDNVFFYSLGKNMEQALLRD